eukprot:gene32598-39414_t
MEILISVENFEESGGRYREINSPRTLEACLRCGLDPSELYPKQKRDLYEKGLTKEMMEIKVNFFEKKRKEKIESVRKERNVIIGFTEKRSLSPQGRSQSPGKQQLTAEQLRQQQASRAAALIEMEEKRLEALKRRQERELSKIVEREQTLAALQQKIQRAEEEEQRKKRLHEKRVAEEKVQEEKRRVQREHELKKLEQDEAEKRRELARKEAEVEEKLKKKRLAMERQLAREARERDAERAKKIEEARLKTESLLKQQEDLAEQNRLKMLEREERILAQLEEKKAKKREEVAAQREKAGKRIAEAMEKFHGIFRKRREDFDMRQQEAAQRAKEASIQNKERLKQQADQREKRNRLRLSRLIDAYRTRMAARDDILQRREMKDTGYIRVQQERDEKIAMLKFTAELQHQDKLENVERVARVTEFRRLQTLQKIYGEDSKFEEIMTRKEELYRSRQEEGKATMLRKHEVAETMERMRATNDFTLLNKLFTKKGGAKKADAGNSALNSTGAAGGRKGRDETEEDPRLNQTV